MKTITIGRGDGCNIYIDDESMSRRHAIIKIPTFGEMEIVDMSKNGTSVNGIRLRPNVPFPVSRKDVVTFADVAQLDWSKVPDPLKYYKLGALIVGGLIVLLLAIFLVKNLFSDSTPEQQPVKPAIEQVQKPVQNDNEQLPQTEQKEEAQTEAPDVREVPATPSNSQETTSGTSNEVFDVMGSARQAKRKLEAEERARQQKAKKQKEQQQKEQQQKEQQQKEQQKQQQKEQQKQEDGKQPSEGNSSKKEYKPEMI